jgi:hypothetical protein
MIRRLLFSEKPLSSDEKRLIENSTHSQANRKQLTGSKQHLEWTTPNGIGNTATSRDPYFYHCRDCHAVIVMR